MLIKLSFKLTMPMRGDIIVSCLAVTRHDINRLIKKDFFFLAVLNRINAQCLTNMKLSFVWKHTVESKMLRLVFLFHYFPKSFA